PTDDSSVKLSKTRGLQIIICIDSEHQHPPPKPHDHTYISVERVEADDKYASTYRGYNIGSSLTLVIGIDKKIEIMVLRLPNSWSNWNLEMLTGNTPCFFYADVWDGVYGTCSKCYETTARLVSYCHPVEKVTQMYGFVANRIKNAGKWTNEDESKRKK
ncbi:unnamed protein product, partial [Porites evermanni]